MEPNRLASIDGLRGVAALCVAVFHFQGLFATKPFFGWGYLNVDLFFILSGFILSKIYESRLLDGTVSGLRFLWRRFVRLWPLHIVTLLLMAVLEHVMWLNTGYHVLSESDNWSSLSRNILLLQNACCTEQLGLSWNKPSWSISVEWIINAAWAAAVIGRHWSMRTAVVVALAGTAILLHLGPNLNSEIVMAFGVLNGGIVRAAVGFSLGYLVNRLALRFPFPNVTSLTLAAMLGCVIVFFEKLPGIDYVCLWLLFPSLVVVAVDERTWISRFLSSGLCTYLGRISYSVYLLHYPLNVIVTNANLFIYSRRFGFAMLQPPTIGIVYIATLLVSASISYALIERPALRLGSIHSPFAKRNKERFVVGVS